MNAKVSLLATVLLAACAPKEPPEPRVAPRPVTVFLLDEADPVKPLLLTGSVRSWKEQDVAFEVEGVVRFVVEPGTNLEGRWVEDDQVRVEGGILARMDTQSYEIALATAAAAVEVTAVVLGIEQLVLGVGDNRLRDPERLVDLHAADRVFVVQSGRVAHDELASRDADQRD